MSRFKTYTKAQFERELIIIRAENKLKGWRDVTEELEAETGETYWEHVYCFPTYNKDLDILIYSSVDRRTGVTREKGSDAVRVIYRLREEGEVFYRKIHKHLRIDTLFENLDVTIHNANFDCWEVVKEDKGWFTEEI